MPPVAIGEGVIQRTLASRAPRGLAKERLQFDFGGLPKKLTHKAGNYVLRAMQKHSPAAAPKWHRKPRCLLSRPAQGKTKNTLVLFAQLKGWKTRNQSAVLRGRMKRGRAKEKGKGGVGPSSSSTKKESGLVSLFYPI